MAEIGQRLSGAENAYHLRSWICAKTRDVYAGYRKAFGLDSKSIFITRSMRATS